MNQFPIWFTEVNMRSQTRRLLALYLASSVIYSVLAIVLRDVPNIFVDETLYTNLARSLCWNGEIAYRAQPVNYPYLLYPITLIPVYWLQSALGGDIYVWIKVFNALLICSSVFPVYLLALNITGNEKKALIASVLTSLMPDMLMCSLEMTESLIWPLSLWMVCFAWKLVADNSIRWGVLTGLFTGLLYATKPGAVAMGAMVLIILLFFRFRKKTDLRAVLVGLGTLLVIVILVYILYVFVFGYPFSLTGLYEKQTSDWEFSHLFVALLGTVSLPFVFIMSGIGIFVLLPYLARRHLDENKTTFLFCSTAGLITVILGTAVFIIPYQWNGSISDIGLHTRYMSMYLPIWIILTLDLGTRKDLPRHTVSKSMRIIAIPFLLLGLKLALIPAQGSSIDTLTLGSFIHSDSFDGTVTGILWTMSLVGLMLYLGAKVVSVPRLSTERLCIVSLSALMLFNSVCGAIGLYNHAPDRIIADALQLNTWINELNEEPLGIMQRNNNDIMTIFQESRLTQPMQQITMDQAVASMNESDGIYIPFVPMDQDPNRGSGLTPDTSTFVLGETVFSQLELSDASTVRLTDHETYAVVNIPIGVRWVDSMLYGLDENTLYTDTQAILMLFTHPEDGATLKINIKAPVAGTAVSFSQGKHTDTVLLSNSQTVELPLTAEAVYIAADHDIEFYGYSTK